MWSTVEPFKLNLTGLVGGSPSFGWSAASVTVDGFSQYIVDNVRSGQVRSGQFSSGHCLVRSPVLGQVRTLMSDQIRSLTSSQIRLPVLDQVTPLGSG